MYESQSPRDTPAYWFEYAQEVRAQAKQLEDPEVKLILAQIAARYDGLAERARYHRLAAWTGHLISRPQT
jgi:hypothetical protein